MVSFDFCRAMRRFRSLLSYFREGGEGALGILADAVVSCFSLVVRVNSLRTKRPQKRPQTKIRYPRVPDGPLGERSWLDLRWGIHQLKKGRKTTV